MTDEGIFGKSVNLKGIMDDPYCPDCDTHLMTVKLMLSAALCAVVYWTGRSITLLMKEAKGMRDELREIIESLDLADKIEGMLPDKQYAGFTIISMVIDKYSQRMGIPTRKAWKMMYSIAMAVCDECGEYGEVKE